METQQMVVLILALVLVSAAVYFIVTAEAPEVTGPGGNETNTTQLKLVEGLLFKGLEFGKGKTEYVYSFSETSDDYETAYTLVRKGNVSMLEVENPLSRKEVYFLENDTILCVNYTGYVCSSVKNVAEVANYIESLRVKFFDDARIDKDMASMRLLIDKKYVTLSPEIAKGSECSTLKYALDFSSLTLSEAALFGISSDSPKNFDFEMCVNNNTGYLYSKKFNYSWQGQDHESQIKLESFTTSAPDIEAPENVSTGAVAELKKEREQSVKLAKCFTDSEGEEREKCISLLALGLKNEELCSLAGNRKDRCLVSLIPILKDEAICPKVTDAGYKDDCYIELAWAFKDEAYCAYVMNASKSGICEQAATPPPPKNESGGGSGFDANSFMQYIEGSDDNQSNTTSEQNTSGNESR
jgi:hypothetical protein